VIEGRQHALADQVVERLEGEVGIDGARAVTQKQGHVVHLARLARLDDQSHLDALALADQVVVDAGGGEEGGDGRVLAIYSAVRQDEIGVARIHRLARPPAEVRHGLGEGTGPARHLEEHGHGGGLEGGQIHVADLRQLGVVENWRLELELPAGFGRGLEQVALGPNARGDLGHQLFTDAVEGRIGHLGEELLEVVVEKPGPVGQHGERRVSAHGADGLLARGGHGSEEQAQVLVRVAEGLLRSSTVSWSGAGRCGGSGSISRGFIWAASHSPYGCWVAKACLSSLSSMMRPCAVSTRKMRPGWRTLLDEHPIRGNVEHAHLRGHDHEIVLGHVVAGGTQAVPVEDGADDRAVGEAMEAGPSHGSMRQPRYS
jgi:hypothetical protein